MPHYDDVIFVGESFETVDSIMSLWLRNADFYRSYQWVSNLTEIVASFCLKHNIEIVDKFA